MNWIDEIIISYNVNEIMEECQLEEVPIKLIDDLMNGGKSES